MRKFYPKRRIRVMLIGERSNYVKKMSGCTSNAEKILHARAWKEETEKARELIIPALKKELSRMRIELEKCGVFTE
jgi:hypothetical protein